MLKDNELEAGKDPGRYYYALGLQHDDILRCKDCQSLVTHADLKRIGSCKCGNRRVAEVTTLSDNEREQIVSGVITFPNSDKFLAEFSLVQ